MNKKTYALVYGSGVWGVSVATMMLLFQRIILKRHLYIGMIIIAYIIFMVLGFLYGQWMYDIKRNKTKGE
jgi:hypothetical protein